VNFVWDSHGEDARAYIRNPEGLSGYPIILLTYLPVPADWEQKLKTRLL